MARRVKTEALVVKKQELLGTDIFVTLLTFEFGKLRVLAKGVKTLSSKRLPHLQTANLIEAVLYKKEDKTYLQETALISGFTKIKNSQQKISVIYYVLFVLDRILPENQKEEEIYNETKKFMITLSRKDHLSNSDLEIYLFHILKRLGYVQDRMSLQLVNYVIEELINEKVPFYVL